MVKAAWSRGFPADGGELFGAGADEGRHTVYVQPKTTIESVSENGKDNQFKVLVGRIGRSCRS
ncbi:MAG: hypothetical protein IPO76_06410 [Elusimicrobia bacterium]|nr:hypothetical protein [Elusimicrobiota bacterium]